MLINKYDCITIVIQLDKPMYLRYKDGEITWTDYSRYLKTQRESRPRDRSFYQRYKRGEISHKEYMEHFAMQSGYNDMNKYMNSFAQRNGYNDIRDYQTQRLHRLGVCLPADKNRECTLFLGVVVAEGVLSKLFDGVQRMPNGTPGYDFVCSRGYLIDVKSSCIRSNHNYLHWGFNIANNKIADYFLMIGFDNRLNLRPQHIWLIKGTEPIPTRHGAVPLNDLNKFYMYDSHTCISAFLKFEHKDKLQQAVSICDRFVADNEFGISISKIAPTFSEKNFGDDPTIIKNSFF